ncbi:MAG: radical SAM protein [Deltaproteobacteria bacterium]|nr:radical SAM protein [Deltaproteobacteria bacterium]
MKVVLVQVNKKNGIDKTSHPHAGLAYLGAYSLNRGYETIAIDAKYEGIDNNEVLNRILKIKPFILGLTIRTPDVKECEKIAAIVKNKTPDTKIIVGGAHVTGIQERVLKECTYFDIGVIGEGEQTFCELLDMLKSNDSNLQNIKGILYRNNNNIIKTPSRDYIIDMDSLLFPAWQLFPSGSDITLFTSRGCPFSCSFCQRVMGQKVRTTSPARVIAEMKRNISDFNATFFQIEDEVFGINKKWINELLDLIIKDGINRQVKWIANSRVNVANIDIYKKMKEAGCIGLGFGVESGNQKILDSVDKGVTLEQAYNAINIAKKAGLQTHTFFILGHPWETKETLRDTINFACKLNPYSIAFGMMIPYPGTKIHTMAKKGEGGYKGFHEDWELYTKYFGKGLELEGLNRSTLERYQKQAYVEFYLRNFRFLDFFKFVFSYLKQK